MVPTEKKHPYCLDQNLPIIEKKLNSYSQGLYPGNIQKTWSFVSMTLGNFKEV